MAKGRDSRTFPASAARRNNRPAVRQNAGNMGVIRGAIGRELRGESRRRRTPATKSLHRLGGIGEVGRGVALPNVADSQARREIGTARPSSSNCCPHWLFSSAKLQMPEGHYGDRDTLSSPPLAHRAERIGGHAVAACALQGLHRWESYASRRRVARRQQNDILLLRRDPRRFRYGHRACRHLRSKSRVPTAVIWVAPSPDRLPTRPA